MINRMQGFKRKLEGLHDEEKTLHEHSRKRIAHLQDLYSIPSLVDESYDKWSRTRLDRLLVDFLLRSGYGNSARQLAEEKGIQVCQYQYCLTFFFFVKYGLTEDVMGD